MCGTDWGCKPNIIMRLYKSYVRPVLEYGSIVLQSASETQIKKIQIIQNKAIRIAYRLHPHSHMEEIHEIANIETIKERFKSLGNKFIHSLYQNSELFKTQLISHASKIKRGQATLLDTLIENYTYSLTNDELEEYVNKHH